MEITDVTEVLWITLLNTLLITESLLKVIINTLLETELVHHQEKLLPSTFPNTLISQPEALMILLMPLPYNQSLSLLMLKPGNSILEEFSLTVELPLITESY